MLKKDSPMSPAAAKIAAQHAKMKTAEETAQEDPAKCLTRYAQLAEVQRKFLSSQEMTGLYIAATVFLSKKDNYYLLSYKDTPFQGVSFNFLLCILCACACPFLPLHN